MSATAAPRLRPDPGLIPTAAGPGASQEVQRLTLHVRLTHACNAVCDYCSAHQAVPSGRMRPAAFAQALAFISERVLPLMGFAAPGDAPRGAVTVQYVGGEILTVPEAELREMVYHARDVLGRQFRQMRDGVQSNLVGSTARVLRLQALFGDRIGTSQDGHSDQRRLAGSATAYRTLHARNLHALQQRRGVKPGAILVVDRGALPHVPDEIAAAEAAGRPLVLRPVFQGGSAIDAAPVPALTAALAQACAAWLMRGGIRIEPFMSLLERRLARVQGRAAEAPLLAGCPFQADCATASLDLEPDGGLYLCLDTADAGQLPLGNALTGVFDDQRWQMLHDRRQHLDEQCRRCTWQAECQGGCLSEALHHTGNPYGRTALCDVWKALFAQIDACIAAHGAEAVRIWMRGLRG